MKIAFLDPYIFWTTILGALSLLQPMLDGLYSSSSKKIDEKSEKLYMSKNSPNIKGYIPISNGGAKVVTHYVNRFKSCFIFCFIIVSLVVLSYSIVSLFDIKGGVSNCVYYIGNCIMLISFLLFIYAIILAINTYCESIKTDRNTLVRKRKVDNNLTA